jgi:RNA-directed DNA polymerase
MVAMKPANKAGRPAAEWVEPRAGTEGNAIQQSTHRTQMRVRVSHVKILEHRIRDQRILRLIRKWLMAGVLEEGVVTKGEVGTPQGATVSPLLANAYLHYVFDLWAHQWRKRHATGDVIIVRYADDAVLGFEHEAEARRILEDLRTRFAEFSLSLHPDKTRLIELGRHAAANRKRQGLARPGTFSFLGFTLNCGKSRHGRFLIHRKTRGDRMRATLRRVKDKLRRRRMHWPLPDQGRWLRQVLTGFFSYHAVPTNYRALRAFHCQVRRLWRRSLSRRSQRGRVTWDRFRPLADDWLPLPHILYVWPEQRFDVRHSRWEPSA